MLDFIYSIDLFWASSAPSGRVARVPVVWASSLHPDRRQRGARTLGRIRLRIRNDVVFGCIGDLAIVVSADGLGTLERRAERSIHSGIGSMIGSRSARSHPGSMASEFVKESD
jgi:hypothetical protein